MRFFIGLSFIFIVILILYLLNINTSTIKDVITPLQSQKNKSLKQLINPKKKSKLAIAYHNIVLALNTMGQLGTLYTIILISFLAIFLGVFTGITLFGSISLSVALALMLASLPYIYTRIQYIEYKDLLRDELETSLSVITSSIERTDNIVDAFKENIENIGEPLNSIFLKFVYTVEHNVPITEAIDDMKIKISNPIFLDWCDALKSTSRDRTLKHQLRPIVHRITDVKIASANAKSILYTERRSFKSVMFMSLLFMLVSYVLIPWGLRALGVKHDMSTVIHIFLSIDILMLFFMNIKSIFLTKDIDFDNV